VNADWMTIAIVANKECKGYVMYDKMTVLRIRMTKFVLMTGDDSGNRGDMTDIMGIRKHWSNAHRQNYYANLVRINNRNK
jgi:hypothetical protein